MATTRTRRTPEQRAADYERKAKAARSQARELDRARDTRRKVIAGGALLAMAEAGDVEAARVLGRIKAGLTRPHDRALFGLADGAGLAELAAAIEAAAARLKAVTDQAQPSGRARAEWVEAVAAWERAAGQFWPGMSDPAKRPMVGLGPAGQVLPAKAA